MNLKLLLLSFTVIVSIHYFVLTYFLKEKTPLQSKANNKPISIQLTKIQKVQIKKTEVKKTKTIVKRKAKKVQKKKKQIKKKQLKKKIVKKKIIEKKKKQTIQKIKKIETKTNTKMEQKVDKKILKKTEAKKIVNQASKESLLLLSKKIQEKKENYFTRLKQYIARYKNYPSISRRLEEEGKSTISFRVLNNGSFTNVKVLVSSGITRLDEAALNSILEAEKFETFDESIKDKYLDFKIHLEYSLE